jgi:DNA modification methylase
LELPGDPARLARARHDRRVIAVAPERVDRPLADSPCHRHNRRIEPGALDFAASGHLYATHGLHPFAARLPPPLARWAIETFTDPGDCVLDVMCGSGTTLVEGLLTGRHAYGVDIDPLARLISLTKATPVPAELVTALADEIERRLKRRNGNSSSWRPALPRLDYWFRADVCADLARLKTHIVAATADGSSLRSLAWTVFSSLIVARTSVANARDLVHSRHHHREWTEDPAVPGRFVRQLRRAARLMQELDEGLAGRSRGIVRLAGSDARSLALADGSVDLTFFSPPYVSALDYPRAHVFAVAWLSDVLGVDVDQYRMDARRYIGTDRGALADATTAQPLPPKTGWPAVDPVVHRLASVPAKAWTVHRYFRDMANVLAECARVTRPGGHVVVVVCPSNIRRVPVDTHNVFAALAPIVTDGRLEVEDTYARTIHDHRRVMPYLEHAFGERMRTEYVIVTRRTASAAPTLVDHAQLRRRRVNGDKKRAGH